MKHKSDQLGTEPIPKMLAKLAIPAMTGTFVMALYNVVAAIFVERTVGTIGVAAISIAFPIQMIIMAIAGAIGIGGASIIARMLGANNHDKANQIFGNVISLVLIISLIAAILGLNFLEPLLYMFGASDTIMPYAKDYMGIILYGTILFAFAFSSTNIIRSEGNAKVAMLSMLVSAILNIILTTIFLLVLDWGIKGAAYATIIAQGTTVIYIILYFARGKSSLSFNLAYLMPKWSIIKEIVAIGFSAFIHMSSSSIMMVVANHMLITFSGDTAVAVLGIVQRIMMFALMPMMGIVQGLTPLAGYNYGAGLHDRVTQSIKLSIKTTTIIATIAFVIIMVFPSKLMLIFTSDESAIEMGTTALRIMFAASLTIGLQMVTGSVFQALGRAKSATVLSMSRQVLFLIPLLLVLPLIWKLTGVWIAFPVADLLAFFLALWYIHKNRDLFLQAKTSVTK
jgi:putative MATE family efflux protein